MKKNYLFVIIFFVLTFNNLSLAEENKDNINRNDLNIAAKIDVKDSKITIKEIDNIKNVQNSKNTTVNKSVKSITTLDVIGDENVSPELRKRVTNTLNKVQYAFDRYDSYIDNHTKSTDSKFIILEKEINNLKTFTEELEANFSLAKFMVISLSIGIICLSAIITIMWKGVVNVNRNDVEVLYLIERVRKEVRSLEKRLEMIETVYKNEKK